MLAYFNRFVVELTRDQAHSGCHQGDCCEDIERLRRDKHINAELERLSVAAVVAELQEYGAWDDEELEDHDANLNRILWLACGEIVDQPPDDRDYDND